MTVARQYDVKENSRGGIYSKREGKWMREETTGDAKEMNNPKSRTWKVLAWCRRLSHKESFVRIDCKSSPIMGKNKNPFEVLPDAHAGGWTIVK